MISEARISGFKCFTDTRIAFAPLTVLSGMNGTGKSSLIQAFLLAQASGDLKGYVPLNGIQGLFLGEASEVLPNDGKMLLDVIDGGTELTWRLEVGKDDDPFLRVSAAPKNAGAIGDLIYLDAERIGPRQLYQVESSPHGIEHVGHAGQYASYLLATHGSDSVHESRILPSKTEVGDTVLKQLEAWLQELFPGIELRAQRQPGLNAASMQIKMGTVRTDWLSPPNVGFGVTYVFPIVLAGLLAPQNGLFIVQNPEAHLHPRAQSRIARFLATIAATGTQVLIETHSDHVLNGLRLAVVDDHPIRPSDIIIHHFTEIGASVEIRISERGNFSETPKAFFDQSESDLAAILRTRGRG